MPQKIVRVRGLTDDEVYQIVRRVGSSLGYREDDPRDEADLRLRRGSLVGSIFAGAFLLYVDCQVYLDVSKSGTVRIALEYSSPWWTGFIGVHRTDSAMTKLVDEIEYRLEKADGEIL